MKIIDPGHEYEISFMGGTGKLIIKFWKKIRGHEDGINNQEYFRVGIDRLKFLNAQEPCAETSQMIQHLRECIRLSEMRALRRKLHRRDEIEYIKPNVEDGHVFWINVSDTKIDPKPIS